MSSNYSVNSSITGNCSGFFFIEKVKVASLKDGLFPNTKKTVILSSANIDTFINKIENIEVVESFVLLSVIAKDWDYTRNQAELGTGQSRHEWSGKSMER